MIKGIKYYWIAALNDIPRPCCATITEGLKKKTLASRLTFLYINSPYRPAFKMHFFLYPDWPCVEQVKHTIHETAQQRQAVALQTLTLCPLRSTSTAWPRLLPERYFCRNLAFLLSFLPSLFFIVTSTSGSRQISREMLTQNHSGALKSSSKSGWRL